MASQIGTVEKVEFTSGSPFGEQYTTIDGVRYMTWFDLRKISVHRGARVRHEPYRSSHNLNGLVLPFLGTNIIEVIPNAKD